MKILLPTFAALVASLALSQAAVTFVGNDLATGPSWRTSSVTKPNDSLDNDNVYGTAGYLLAAGLRAGYKDPWLTNHIITGTSNSDAINTLPAYITSLEFTDPAQRGRSWGGSGGNFGTLDNVGGGHTGQTGAAILLSPGGTGPMSLTLKRNASPAFRLTLILGNANEAGFNDAAGQSITLNDGSGAITQAAPSPGNAASTTYQTWHVAAGSSDITILLEGLPTGVGVARLSGIAIDTVAAIPPGISTHPAGGSGLVGTPFTFTVSASGSAPLTYNWRKDGIHLGAPSSPSFTITNLALSDAGSYDVIVTNTFGSVTSTSAILTVSSDLPTSNVNYQNAIRAESSLLSEYTFDGNNVSDAVGTNHGTLQGTTVFATGIGSGGDRALVLNGAGHARLGVVPAFAFSDTTGSVEAWVRADWTAAPGGNPALFASRNGGPTRWSIHMDGATKNRIAFWNGASVAWINIPMTLANTNWHHIAVTFDAGSWSVYWDGQLAGTAANNLVGGTGLPTQLGSATDATTSESWRGALDEVAFYADALSASQVYTHYAAFAGNLPPVITSQPVGGTCLVGESLTLRVAAGGTPPLSYQWRKNGTNLTGEAGTTMTLASLGTADAGSYDVVVTGIGSTNSRVAVVGVESSLPRTVLDYQAELQNELFLVSEYSFDHRDASDVMGMHDGTLSGVTAFTAGPSGGADKALLLDGRGHARLGSVADFTFAAGIGAVEAWVRADWSSISYSPTIVANSDATTRWSIRMNAAKTQITLFNGTATVNANIPNAGTNWHYLVASYSSETVEVYWDSALVATLPHPLPGPTDQPTQIGSTSDSITANGWVGALDEVAFYSDLLAGDRVLAHYNMRLGVLAPTVTTQPIGGSCPAGSRFTFRATATGTLPLQFQWRKGGVNINGATNAALALNNLSAADAADYTVVVSNVGGSTNSAIATLTVEAAVPRAKAAYQAAVRAESSLLSLYSFDCADASDTVGSNHGSLSGVTTIGAGNALGTDKALVVTGTGHARLGGVPAFEFTDGTGTVEAWVRADWNPATPPPYNPAIFGNRNGGPTRWSIHMLQNKQQLAFWNGGAASVLPIPDPGTAWHHFACVFDAGSWRVYWDGKLLGSPTIGLGSGAALTTQLGSAADAPTMEGWVGALDEVAIYADALTSASVEAHYTAYAGPALSYIRNGNSLTLTWAAGVGATLESSDVLPGTTWSPVPGVANNSVTLDASTGMKFYRLRIP